MIQKKMSAARIASLRLSALAMCLGATTLASAHPGDLDPMFGTGGVATVPSVIGTMSNMRVAFDDRVLVGYNTTPDHGEIAALTEAGTTDTSFGTSGFVELGDFEDIKVDSKQRYVVLGHAASGTSGVEVMRYMNNGSLDATFGVGGIAVVTNDSSFNGVSIALDDDDNVVVAGGEITPYSPQIMFAARVTNAGDLDGTFGKHGIRSLPLSISGGEETLAQAVAIDHSGSIYVSGYSYEPSLVVNRLVKLKPDGAIDKRFGPGSGVVTSDVNPATSADFTFAGGITIDAKNNVVIAGGAGSWSSSRMFVARYRPDGSVDPTFGGGTYELLNVETSTIAQAKDVMIDERGRIVLTGIAQDGATGEVRMLAARLKKDGSIDGAFGAHLMPTSAWVGAGTFGTNGNVLVVGDATTHDSVLIDEVQAN